MGGAVSVAPFSSFSLWSVLRTGGAGVSGVAVTAMLVQPRIHVDRSRRGGSLAGRGGDLAGIRFFAFGRTLAGRQAAGVPSDFVFGAVGGLHLD